MSIPPLERAIALLEQGKRHEAQKLLKQLITEDQRNLTAWFWLVETCTTNGQQLSILEMCLEYNPDNKQVQQALEKLRTLSPAQFSAKLPKYEGGSSGSSMVQRPLVRLLVGGALGSAAYILIAKMVIDQTDPVGCYQIGSIRSIIEASKYPVEMLVALIIDGESIYYSPVLYGLASIPYAILGALIALRVNRVVILAVGLLTVFYLCLALLVAAFIMATICA